MRKQLLLLVTLLAILAWMVFHVSQLKALTISKYPCTPMFLAGPQGRPLPSTVTMVTDLNMVQQTVYLDTLGNGATTNPIVPANTQVLQFYVDTPGEYITTVTSSGTTKQYWVTCGLGFGTGVGKVSIDRTADLLLYDTTSPPFGLGQITNRPWSGFFHSGENTFALYDFIMPAGFPLTLDRIQLSWHESLAGGHPGNIVVWYVQWCVYAVGEDVCDIMTGSPVSIATMGDSGMKRSDTVFPGASIAPAGAWPQNVHVLVAVGRNGLDSRDNYGADAGLDNVQTEFSR